MSDLTPRIMELVARLKAELQAPPERGHPAPAPPSMQPPVPTTPQTVEPDSSSATPFALDPVTLRLVLGPRPDAAALAAIEAQVRAAITQYQFEVATGPLGPGVLLVRGRPLADYLDLDTVARLLRERGPRCRGGREAV